MNLWKLMVVYVILCVLILGLALTLIIKGCKDIDEAGGIKALVERVWEGKK